MERRVFVAIDLKAFYASVECVERGLNPLDACLVVADRGRTEKTICLAVSAALKGFGVAGRPRLFEVVERVKEFNRGRGGGGRSISGGVVAERGDVALDYVVATPRMRLYMDYSRRVMDVYLRFVAEEDVHVYSVDEVFIDVTPYLGMYGVTAHELTRRMIGAVLKETGITATAGIGPNMYLCKVAMDIMAKRMAPDEDGVRIAELDELSYRRELWGHRPLTDFWRVGSGIARRLEGAGLMTMGDIALASMKGVDWFFREFGVNAELLIDHAWGWEPVRMSDVKGYRPVNRSMSSGQVLQCGYCYEKALTVAMEMADDLAMRMVEEGVVTNQVVLTVGYDAGNLRDEGVRAGYAGRVSVDRYGREVPVHAHGTLNLRGYTSSGRMIMEGVRGLFERIVNRGLLVKRITLGFNRILAEGMAPEGVDEVQLELFTDYVEVARRHREERIELERERRRQRAIVELRKRFGKGVVMRGLNYADGATQRERNGMVGGHRG